MFSFSWEKAVTTSANARLRDAAASTLISTVSSDVESEDDVEAKIAIPEAMRTTTPITLAAMAIRGSLTRKTLEAI